MSETICAIASGNFNSGIGIVRISGAKSREIADKIIKKSLTPRYAYFGNFYNNNTIIDQGIAIFFPAPNSFTGEDVLELQGHGGSAVMQNILQAALNNGAQLATAGEFSKRAFLNGKIDLVQAEAVADMIQTNSTRVAKLAINSLIGEFSKNINNLRKQIIELRVFVEATIDFVDEEIDFIQDHKVQNKLNNIDTALTNILTTANQGAVLKNGINIAIIGKPNAGKSSLLNALTREDSAIVTDIPGTTRDTIKEQIQIDGIVINLIDTAGIRTSTDAIENIGIKKAKTASKSADITLLVFESGQKPDMTLLQENKSYILVQNKIDIDDNIEVANAIKISAKNNIGIDLLKSQILKLAGIENLDENISLARVRHIEELKFSLEFIKNAKLELTGSNIELVAQNLHFASVHLGKITGEFTTDDLLGEIFSSFCIGK